MEQTNDPLDIQMALDSRPGQFLDCITGNFGLVLAINQIDQHEIFGSLWYRGFDYDPASSRATTASMEDAFRQRLQVKTNITISEHKGALSPERGDWAILVGDAYYMPWTPYYKQVHMEHGLSAVALDHETIYADPYDTATAFGAAHPILLDRLPKETSSHIFYTHYVHEFESIKTTQPPTFDVYNGTMLDAERYVAQFSDSVMDLNALATDIWMILRARNATTQWTTTGTNQIGQLNTELNEILLPAWEKANEQCYLALRRAQRNKPVPPSYKFSVIEALNMDDEIVRRMDCAWI